jgi:Short C-terminal domain/Phospholipase_D-nuclease N-terminal
MNSFWEWFWIAFLTFAFVAYLFAMFTIIVDLFRDKTVSGWMKAVWFIFLILFPVLTALVYLIARGGGMAERQMKDAQAVKEAQDSYIRDVAGSSPADQIAKAKELHNSGAITDEEYEALKAKALS